MSIVCKGMGAVGPPLNRHSQGSGAAGVPAVVLVAIVAEAT
jgi:hypothetical protein